jgi:hypothetical protein
MAKSLKNKSQKRVCQKKRGGQKNKSQKKGGNQQQQEQDGGQQQPQQEQDGGQQQQQQQDGGKRKQKKHGASKWIEHVKSFANRNGIDYRDALENKDCKAEYHAKK